MFYRYRVVDIVNIKPKMFREDLQEAAWKQLRDKYVGLPHKDLGYVIMISRPKVDTLGKIIAEDGSSNHKAEFFVYSFKPVKGEVVEGTVVEIQNFGVFVRIAGADALAHKSVLMDDIVDINRVEKMVIGKKTRRVMRVGDTVRGRVVDVALPKKNSLMKIALYMKSPYLGKLEWIEENISGQKVEAGGEEK